jgi:hypothetical protein
MQFNLAIKIKFYGPNFQGRMRQQVRHSLCFYASDAEINK